MECYEGRVSLPPGTESSQLLPSSLLPESTCQSLTGLCFASLTRGQSVTVLSLGCWPQQHHLQLAWYGVPQCKNEVRYEQPANGIALGIVDQANVLVSDEETAVSLPGFSL